MSKSYYLICLDCKSSVIDLGKAIHRKYPASREPTLGFNSLAFEPNRELSLEHTLLDVECLDHFLMLHRGHHLIATSELVDCYATKNGFTFPTVDEDDPDYSRTVFLNTPVSPTDHKKELKDLPEYVVNKLKEF